MVVETRGRLKLLLETMPATKASQSWETRISKHWCSTATRLFNSLDADSKL